MTEQMKVLEILNRELAIIKSRNPSYSLRAFAKKLRMPPSTLSGIMSGKLPVTRKSAEKILTCLCVDPDRSKKILSKLRNKNLAVQGDANVVTATQPFTQINMDQYHAMSDWWYFAILSLAETQSFQSNSKWISRRLNVSETNVRIALKRLGRLGLLSEDNKGRYVATGKQFKTSTDIANQSLRKSHFQNVELARKSLEKDLTHECDFTAMTMAIDPAKLPEAKKLITKFRRELCSFLESDKKLEVYKILISLFPITDLKLNSFNSEVLSES